MIKRLLKKSYTAHVGWYMLRNLRHRADARRYGQVATGGAYSSRTPRQAAERAFKWASEIRKRVSSRRLERLDFVVEFGVGDSLAMAVLWIGFGAQKVWGIDAFGDPRDPRRERAVFEELLELSSPEERQRIRQVLDFGGNAIALDPDRVRYVENTPCERLLEKIPAGSADLVYSLALLEHVADLDRALRSAYSALSPAGEMVHRVDLRNHGVLEEFGDDAFLRPPSWVWRLMGGDRGLHNRKPLASYRDVLEECGAEVSVESDPQFETEVPGASDGETKRKVRVFWLKAKEPSPPASSRPTALAGFAGA